MILKNHQTRAISLVILVLFTFLILIVGCNIYLGKPGSLNEDKTIIIPRGASSKKVVSILAENNVVDNPSLFLLIYKIKYRQTIKSGEYLFNTNISPAEVLALLVHGKVVIHKLTVPEGSSKYEIIKKINDTPNLLGDIDDSFMEGYLLPETYFYTYGEKRQDLLLRMHNAAHEALARLWENRVDNLPYASKEEAMVMASIIEKETSIPDERPRIAAVFINRLKKKMKLQADPTVAYGIGGGVKMERKLTKADLELPSAYNTYVIFGLPPTPIACPGIESIAAALSPMDTDELYFVVQSDGNTRHEFANSLKDHNSNVQNYRKTMKASQ